MKGGNTEDLYLIQNGRKLMAESLKEQHPDVVPAVEIEQRMLEVAAGQELDAAGRVAAGARLPHGFGLRRERRAHVANRLDRQHRPGLFLRLHGGNVANARGAEDPAGRSLAKARSMISERQ